MCLVVMAVPFSSPDDSPQTVPREACRRPSGLGTTSDIACMVTTSLKVSCVSPRSQGAHKASTRGFHSCCMNMTLRSFTHSWKEERQYIRVASEPPVLKGLI